MLRILVSGLALLAVAPAAEAASIQPGRSACDGRYGITCPTPLAFVAAPGEANDVAGVEDPGAVLFRDRVAPTGICPVVDAQTVRCPVSEGGAVVTVDTGDGADAVRSEIDTVRLGAGDDRFVGAGSVDGGAGDDDLRAARPSTLTGGAGDDVLTGSDGGDVLGGGPGRDVVLGLGGDDRVQADDADVPAGEFGYGADPAADAPASDRLDGGPGRDTVSWARRRDGIRLDLRAGRAGTGAEADRLAGFEVVHGSAGPDRLAGTDGPDDLRGLAGDDVLLGRGGDDVLRPAEHPDDGPRQDPDERDVVRAGPGADAVLGVGAGTVRCGPGADAIDRRFRGGVALLARDCEAVRLAVALGVRFVEVVPARRRVDGRLRLGVRCPMRAGCHLHVTVRARLHRFAVPFGHRRVRVPMPRPGRVRLDLRAFPDGTAGTTGIALEVR